MLNIVVLGAGKWAHECWASVLTENGDRYIVCGVVDRDLTRSPPSPRSPPTRPAAPSPVTPSLACYSDWLTTASPSTKPHCSPPEPRTGPICSVDIDAVLFVLPAGGFPRLQPVLAVETHHALHRRFESVRQLDRSRAKKPARSTRSSPSSSAQTSPPLRLLARSGR